jgi:ABC-type amino acid transport substrate-binding protein
MKTLVRVIPALGAVAVLFVAGGRLAAADGAAVLRVGVTPNAPPMIFKKGREVAGAEADLAAALGKELGRPIKFVEQDWDDLIPALLDDKIDIIMSSMSITMARQTRVAFSTPYLKVSQMVLARGDQVHRYGMGIPLDSSAAIGVKAGTTADFLVQQEFPRAKRKTFKSGEEAAQALTKKRINLFVSDSTMIWWLAGEYEAQGLAVLPLALSEEYLAWAVRKSDAQLLEAVNRFQAQARQNGQLGQVLKRWIPNYR